MKKIFSGCAAAIFLTAALCGCDRTVVYPEGADGLPTVTAHENSEIMVYYDTSQPPELDTDIIITETEAETVTTTVPETSETEEETTVTVSSEDEFDVITWASESELGLADVPVVGISEYYNRTQTMNTRLTEPSVTTSLMSRREEPTSTGTVTATQPQSVTVLSAATTSDVTTAYTGNENPGTANINLHQDLTDGRISRYTGREIISHPMCYYSMDDRSKKLYDKLVSALLAHADNVTFSLSEKLTFDELFDSYQIIYNNEFRLFYISTTIEYIVDSETGFVKNVDFVYTYDKDKTAQMKQIINTEADKILSQITPSMGDYEIVKLFHDSVITSCRYEENADQNTIYGVFGAHKALCQGYSKTMTYLCSLAGIQAAEVLGIANEEHMWNIVKMDGDYYHVDLTWDDPDKTDYPDSVRYDYFGLTDSRIKELRTVRGGDFTLPAASGTKYNYYTYNDLVANSMDEVESIIIRETARLSETKSSTIQFMCADSRLFDAATSRLFSNRADNVISVLDKAEPQISHKLDTDTVHHNSNKNTRTIKIYLQYKD